MKTRRFALIATAVLSLAACCVDPAQAQSTYTLIELGTTSGQELHALNNAGQIAGKVYDSRNIAYAARIVPLDTNGDGKPDTWFRDANHDGKNDLLQTLAIPKSFGYVGVVRDINSAGDIAGEVSKTYATLPQSAAVWRNGNTAATVLNTTTGTKEASSSNALNDNSDLAGWYRTGSGPLLPALWRKNAASGYSRTLLGLLPGADSGNILALNNVGQAAGLVAVGNNNGQRPVLWSPGGQAPLDLSYPGDVRGSAEDISQAGQVLVFSYEPIPGFPNRAAGRIVLFTPDVPNSTVGTLSKLGVPAANSYLAASALNNAVSVQIVGSDRLYNADTTTGTFSDVPNSQYGFVWDAANQYRNLNAWATNLPTGGVVTSASDINDSGLILALYQISGVNHYCLLVPNS